MLDGDKLTVDCVWNWSAYPDNPAAFEPYATSTTIIILKSDTEWLYESNEVTKKQFEQETDSSVSENTVVVSMVNISKSIEAFDMKENDTAFGWTLTEIEPYDTPPEAAFYGFLTFTGEVTLTGTITHVNAIYDGFEFIPDEESMGKILIPDGNPEKQFFVSIANGTDPSIFESISELAINKSGEYTVVLTQYHLAYVPMMATNNAIASSIERR